MPDAALPDPRTRDPIPAHPRVGFLAPYAEGRANVRVGPWTYADDPEGLDDFFERRVLYHFEFIGDRLDIGTFRAVPEGGRFVMNGGGHAAGGFSTYPFEIFGLATPDAAAPPPKDTVVAALRALAP